MATFGINFLIICSNTTQFDLQQKNINRTIFRIFRKRGGAVEIRYASLLYVEFSVEFSAKTFWHRQLITAPPSRIGLSSSINYGGSKLILVCHILGSPSLQILKYRKNVQCSTLKDYIFCILQIFILHNNVPILGTLL